MTSSRISNRTDKQYDPKQLNTKQQSRSQSPSIIGNTKGIKARKPINNLSKTIQVVFNKNKDLKTRYRKHHMIDQSSNTVENVRNKDSLGQLY